jgi:hypothetical protein
MINAPRMCNAHSTKCSGLREIKRRIFNRISRRRRLFVKNCKEGGEKQKGNEEEQM